MNQLLLGASIPFILALAVYLARHCRASLTMLVLTPLAMLASAIWAVVPDLPRAFGFHDLYMRLSRDPRCNIFYWHYSIDQMETDWAGYDVLFIAMVVLLLCAAWRETYLEEKKN